MDTAFFDFVKLPNWAEVVNRTVVPSLKTVTTPTTGFFVYFLYRDTCGPLSKRILYIGQTTNPRFRLYKHKERFNYDYAILLQVINKQVMHEAEVAAIKAYRPVNNKLDNPDRTGERFLKVTILDRQVSCPKENKKLDYLKCEECPLNRGYTTKRGYPAWWCGYNLLN